MRSNIATLTLGSLVLALTIPCLTGCAAISTPVIDNSVVRFNVSDRPLPAALDDAGRTHTVYVMADAAGEYALQAKEILDTHGISTCWLSGTNTAQITSDKGSSTDTVFLHLDTSDGDTVKDLSNVLDSFVQSGYTFGVWSGDTSEPIETTNEDESESGDASAEVTTEVDTQDIPSSAN